MENRTEHTGRNPGAGTILLSITICIVLSGISAYLGVQSAYQKADKAITENSTKDVEAPDPPELEFSDSSEPALVTTNLCLESTSEQTSKDASSKTAGTYAEVAEAVTPTVVEISTESLVTIRGPLGGSYVSSGAGSGVIIQPDGLILTNHHVIDGAETITVTLKDGTKYTAQKIGADAGSDIAILKIDASGLPAAFIGNSDELRQGQEVLAVGNPLGEYGGSVTNGIISALSREIKIDGVTMKLLQTNAAVNPGNSGGGLFNLYGELIGIVNAKSSSTASGTAVEGIGFAIPINDAMKIAAELNDYGYVRGKAALGISYLDIDDVLEMVAYRVNAMGMYITDSAYTDELKNGDRVIAIDGQNISYSSDVKSMLTNYMVGDEVTVTVVRSGKYIDVKATLHEYIPEENASPRV